MAFDQLSSTFSALSDPTRRAILTRLASGEASVQDLAEPFQITLPAVSKHLKVLEKAKLIRRGRTAQCRPSYLEATPLKEAAEWVEQYRPFWEQSVNQLDVYAKVFQDESKEKKKKRKKKGRKSKKIKRN